jgi:phage major head subunit gpT-like protein
VDCQGAAISLETLTTGVDALGNVEDDGGKPVLIDPDFLVVGNLADLAREGSASEGSKSHAQGSTVSQSMN